MSTSPFGKITYQQKAIASFRRLIGEILERYRKYLRVFALFIIVLGFILSSMVFQKLHSNSIPIQIQSKLNFSPFVISRSSKNYSTSKYKLTKPDNNTQILSYEIHKLNSPVVSLSEYAQPSEFSDIPEYKNTFLTNIVKQYASVATSNGTIYLGRLARHNNSQIGVMIERGVLILMSPASELNQNDWRLIGNQLSL